MMRRFLALLLLIVSAMGAYAIKTSDLVWHAADTLPLHGTLAHDTRVPYSRIPDAIADTLRPELADLGRNSAGLYIRFASNASAIGARWKAVKRFNMNHMTPTGIRGLDLYVRTPEGQWTTVSSARPLMNSNNTTTMVVTDMTPAMREYMLYLPLYDGVDSIFIGVDSAATIERPRIDSPRRARPVVMYGTSILQGGCATRPGMVHTSILGRMLDREVVNLGFSGNARLDLGIAKLIAASDASAIVLDPLPNLTTEQLTARMPAFVAEIRRSQPHTPILLVESPIFPIMRFNNEVLGTITEKNKALRKIYDDLIKGGDKNVFYFEGERCLGDNWEGTVDNYHFTDLGFTHFAGALYPILDRMTAGR